MPLMLKQKPQNRMYWLIVLLKSISVLLICLTTLEIPVVTPVFMENKSGKAKIISFHAKKARGAMARFIVQNKLTDKKKI